MLLSTEPLLTWSKLRVELLDVLATFQQEADITLAPGGCRLPLWSDEGGAQSELNGKHDSRSKMGQFVVFIVVFA